MLNKELKRFDGLVDFNEELITSESNLEGYSDFYKEFEASKVWWIDKIDVKGEFLFSFDQKKFITFFLTILTI